MWFDLATEFLEVDYSSSGCEEQFVRTEGILCGRYTCNGDNYVQRSPIDLNAISIY